MSPVIKVIVNGCKGRVGMEIVKTVPLQADMQLVGQADIKDDLAAMIQQTKATVVVDFTSPSVRMANVKTIVSLGANAVIGTTGFTPADLEEVRSWCKEYQRGVIIAPNFALGVILMMQFAKQAAKYFPDVEIIEYHHHKKEDFPSGTAVKTAQMLAEIQTKFNTNTNDKVANLEHARGAELAGIRVHAVRLPGMNAHQEIIFGGLGQYLTLRHDTLSREAYMSGVMLAIREVLKAPVLIYGLEGIIA